MNLGTIGNFALNYVIAAYRAAFTWFGSLLGSIGLYEFVVVLILFTIAFGMIIMPFRGRNGLASLNFGIGAGSDSVRPRGEHIEPKDRNAGYIEPGKELIWR